MVDLDHIYDMHMYSISRTIGTYKSSRNCMPLKKFRPMLLIYYCDSDGYAEMVGKYTMLNSASRSESFRKNFVSKTHHHHDEMVTTYYTCALYEKEGHINSLVIYLHVNDGFALRRIFLFIFRNLFRTSS